MGAEIGAVVPLSARSDAALVARCAAGHSDALGLFYDRHASRAYSLARRVVRDPDLAEDVVQEAFLAVWHSAGRFDAERATARTWLLSLVHHKAVDVVRREQLRSVPTESSAGAHVSSVEGRVEQADDGAAIRLAVRLLPAAQRRVLELAYFDGFTQAQVAALLGEPIGTIKSRTRIALVRLRADLAGHRRCA